MRLRTCAAEGCEEKFQPANRWQIYHSPRCATRQRNRDLRKKWRKQRAGPASQRNLFQSPTGANSNPAMSKTELRETSRAINVA